METTNQLTLPLPSCEPKVLRQHLDFPLKPLPTDTLHNLQRLSSRWSRGQTVRSLRLHGVR